MEVEKTDIWMEKIYNVIWKLRHLSEAENIKIDESETSITPSEYAKQMLITTNERTEWLLNLRNRRSCQANFYNSKHFEILPCIVIFQQFLPGDKLNVTVTVRNITQVSRYLKLSCEPNPFFSLEFCGTNRNMLVAPGLSQTYNIKFNPEEKQDYHCQIKCVSDTETFHIPIIAIGPRGLLDFPDRVQVPLTAVKISSSKPILVRNIGNATAVVTLYSDNPCFCVEPSKGRIEKDQTVQFIVNFLSAKPGEFEGNLFLKYETGEKIRVELQGSAVNCIIRMDRGSVRMDETYLGMSRSKVLTIHNRSDYVVKFRWMMLKDNQADEQLRKKYQKLYSLIHDMEVVRCVDLAQYNICMPDIHELICQRIYADEITSLANEKFHYNHMCFLLTPEEGEIWPQSSANITVLFHALEVGEVVSTAYLEVTGREDRIPLSLYGLGKGPIFGLNVLTIDVKNIYLCSVHNYEIVAANKGHIFGTLVYRPKPTDFGGTIKVTPSALALKPDEYKSFNLSFSSNRKGNFVERVDFVVKESLEVQSLHIKGCIVCPTLHFDRNNLDFGTTALGFSTRQEVYLQNLSLMPVSFSITVPNDGLQPPLTYEEFAKAQTKPSFPTNPREFTISPEEGVVPAHASLKIKITYTANIRRSGRSIVRVDMWDSDSDPVTMPITFCGDVASLLMKPAEIAIRFCFINFPYSRSITIENHSDLDGYFYLVPQPVSDSTSIVCSASTYQCFLKARQSKTIDVTTITRILGKQSVTLSMLTMGEQSPITSCVIVCNGQGPVISAQPPKLDFGEIQVLQEETQKFLLISDAPIPAQFKATMAKKNSPWSVSPNMGELEPNGSMEIEVKLYLRDSGRYTDNIMLAIVNSRSIPVCVTATGVGCSIVFEPDVFPIFDMGLVFSHQKIDIPIIMKNLGTRHGQIIWSNEAEFRIPRHQTMETMSKTKFQVDPNIVDIPAGTGTTVYCKLFWNVNEVLQEEWYVFAQIQGQGKRELLGTSIFKATFTEPQILFSKKSLTFRIDMFPDGDDVMQIDELFVTNNSRLNLNVQVSIEAPFHLINDKGEVSQKMKMTLLDKSTTQIRLNFAPKLDDAARYSQSYCNTLWLEYDEHPNRDKIKCTGLLNFPNLTFSCKDLIINSVLGSSAEKILTLTNNGPIPATYKFYWIEKSIRIECSQTEIYDITVDTCSENNPSVREYSGGSQVYVENLSSRQDGSGDAPEETLPPPSNSPASEEFLTQRSKFGATPEPEVNLRVEETDAALIEIRNFLLPMIEKYFVEDTEIPALDAISFEQPTIPLIDQILDIVPREGTVLPYSRQHVHFGFHGLKAMRANASVVCEIVRGPTEVVNVSLRADSIQFSVDKRVIDFGQQLLCKYDCAHVALKNHSSIDFLYKVYACNSDFNTIIDDLEESSLKVTPNEGSCEPRSSVMLKVEHKPAVLGPFKIQFELQVAHFIPFAINVKGVGTFPQIYLSIRRENIFEMHPAAIGYSAIQALTQEFIIKKVESLPQDKSLADETNSPTTEGTTSFSADEWVVVKNKDILPTVIDIEMAIERLLAAKFLDKNVYALTKYTPSIKKQVIPYLYTPEYIIDMGHLIIGLTTCYTTTLVNYGPWNAEVKLKKPPTRDFLEKHGLMVQFKKQSNLRVGDSAVLHVVCNPTQEIYKERSTDIKHTIYLEVTHGCTIPVTIRGVVTYPYITVDIKHLDFQEVFVGECSMMCILVQNESFVDCLWEAKLSERRKKQKENPFSLHYDSSTFPRGQSRIVRIYFRPQRMGPAVAKLNVTANMSLESHIVTLTGHGIKRELNIIEPTIKFLPKVPFTQIQEEVFTVEAACQYPVEFFWRHLDSSFMHEDRVAEVLTRYYQTDEILLPPRKLGEPMPSLLMDFYNNLVNEMTRAMPSLSVQEKFNIDINNTDEQESKSEQATFERSNVNEPALSNDSESHSAKFSKNNYPCTLIIDENNEIDNDLSSLVNNPEKIQEKLCRYIENLQKKSDFSQKMEDPVADLFDTTETKFSLLSDAIDPLKPAKKVCIIFHGAPFTAFQETACRTAKVLNVPVLRIDKAILETMALGESSCSLKLRQIIDDAYQKYLTAYEKHRDVLSPEREEKQENVGVKEKHEVGSPERKAASEKKSSKPTRTPLNAGFGDASQESETNLCLHRKSDALAEFNKIPDGERLESMEPLDRYECKVQAISQLQKILSRYAVDGLSGDKGSLKGSQKSASRRQDTFLDIDAEMLTEALDERLSKADFGSGFVVQNLKNLFIDDAVASFLLLLRIVGHVEYFLLVTFLNSTEICSRKIDELRELNATKRTAENIERIQDIENMSLSDYDLLSQEDKRSYLEAILPIRKEEALHRRMQFNRRMAEKSRIQSASLQHPKSRKGVKLDKTKLNKPVSEDATKSVGSKRDGSKTESSSKKAKSKDGHLPKKERTTGEIDEIAIAMNEYYANLSAMEEILRNWDPIKKVLNAPLLGKNKIPKTAKSRDKTSIDTSREQIYVEKFNIWYVRSSDPWSDNSYNIIISQMIQNQQAKRAIYREVAVKPDLRPKMYNILRTRDPVKQSIQTNNNVFQLVSILTHDTRSTLIESEQINEINIMSNHGGNKKNRKTRRRTSSNKIDDLKSLNASTIESKDTSISFEQIMEETVKPRWILQPNEIRRFKVRFQPKKEGIYKEIYRLEIPNSNNTCYEIIVDGTADIPRLDMNPTTIFTKVENVKTAGTTDPTYILESKTYDFGPILILRKDKKPYRKEGHLKFSNISTVDAEVFFFLAEDSSELFTMEPNHIFITPGECGLLKISAGATKLGTFSDRLLLCIKDNPRIETVELRCEGSKLDIELDGRPLSFDRVLLHRREIRILTIRNRSSVPVFWCIETEEPIEQQITFTPIRGIVETQGQQKVDFSFHATKIGSVEKAAMIFKAFLHEEDDEPILTEAIPISGETYDVAVDINHANPLDLNCVKVDNPTTACFTIKNRGNYEIKYVVTLEDDEKLTKIGQYSLTYIKQNLEVTPACGSVLPQKVETVQVTFIPKNEITLKESPILKCHLLDANNKTTIVAELPLTVSLVAYYTRFSLYPYPDINFGSMSICTQKTMHLNIENTGLYPLYYTISVPADIHPSAMYMSQIKKRDLAKKGADRETDMASRKDKKSSKTTSIKLDPESADVLEVGSFVITKTEDNLEVGQTDTIAIECFPEFVGSQEEKIIVHVPDSVPSDREGKGITLAVKSCMPSIDFQDLDSMFRENYLIDDIQHFNCPKEIGAHTVFSKQEICLYFRYVCVSNTHLAYFKLHNRNVVPADVEVAFLSESLVPQSAKLDTFTVEPTNGQIAPMCHKRFAIAFTPELIATYQGIVEIAVKLPPHLADDKFSVKLVGESCVPEISIIEPPRGKREHAVLNFGCTLVSEDRTRKFGLKNVGVVGAKAIVEICKDSSLSFALTSSTVQYTPRICIEDKDMTKERCTVVRLTPEAVEWLEIKFSPKDAGKHAAEIRVLIIGNPYENLAIELEGEGYVELIVLQGLDLVDTKSNVVIGNRNQGGNKIRKAASKQGSLASGSTARILAASLSYNLDYGLCFINKMYNITFRIVNKSTDRWFRFQWSAHPNVVFIPSVGHLKSMGRKEITATFLASEPMSHVKSPIECAICEIGAADSLEETTWDDRQTVVQWEEMDSGIGNHRPDVETLARKVVEPAIEPDHQIVPGTAKHIEVLLSAIVAFSQYSCAISEVNYKDTLMFQKREYSFTLSNPSVVNMVYAWKISMDVQYPIRPIENDLRSKLNSNRYIPPQSNFKQHEGMLEITNNSGRKLNNSQRIFQNNKQNASHLCKPLPASANTIEVNPPTCRCPPSDLFSSTAGLTERSTDSWLEGDDLPFEISPTDGILPPQGSIKCTLKFSPMDVFIYKAYLTCKIENLDPTMGELVITITGKSLLPYCHFDVPESDYLHSGRRDPQLPGPLGYEIDRSLLPEHTTVIEFKVIGVGGTHVKKFHMINPTADDYHFTWKDRTVRPEDEVPNFHCTIPEGIAERGKRTDLSFAFLAEDVGTFESFWLFSIERYNVERLFLLVGTVVEPSVHCLPAHVKMKPTVLGAKVRDSITMFNDEAFSVSFRISEDSLYSEGRAQRLVVTPMCGALRPKSEQIICVEYYPTLAGEFNFVLQIIVKTMKKAFSVSVVTTAYDITPFVEYIDSNGQIVEIRQGEENVVNLGNMTLREPVIIEFNVTNSGQMTFYYKWDLGMTPEIVSKNSYALTMPQKEGHVAGGSQSTCYLSVTAFQRVAIKDHRVGLKISRGPIYRFILKATVKAPCIKFSFKEYDFGACYIEDSSVPANQTELLISNVQDTLVILEGKFEDLPHMSANLDGIAKALPAHSTVKVPISFTPLRETKYRETLRFLINSTVEKKIPITGEGISYKIRLANPRDKSIDLGILPANKTSTRKIPVINEGRAPVNLQFDLARSLPGYEETWKRTRLCVSRRLTEETGRPMVRASISETKRSGTQDVTLQTNEPSLAEVLRLEPSGLVTLPPGGRKNLVVVFRPTCRMKRFTAKVALQVRSRVMPLFVVHGACAGAEFRLDRKYVSFGAVVKGCTGEVRVLLSNTGDVGARFGWNTSKLPGDFSIAPISGYCSPGTDVSFVVRFEPSREQSLIEGHASLDIERYDALNLKITGRCSKLPEPVETLSFTSNVRERQTKHVNIVNDTAVPWELKPEATGDYFGAEKVLHVPSKSSATCAIAYAPMVINDDNSLHLGTLFLKLPDDKTPILYSLRGLALPPQAVEKIARQFPAKTKYAESFVVHNWLNRQQQFQCSIERLTNTKDQKKDVPLFSFNGSSKIEVPANGQRDYRAVFHSHEECIFQFKVTFTNEEGEYQFYEVHYTVTEPEVIESIKLHTTARSSVCHVLRLENPLEDQSITYTAQCRHPYVVIRDTPKVVPPLGTENIGIDYCPLLSSKEVRVTLDIDCQELGHFPYELRLKAISAPPEKLTRVHATLGSFSKFSLPINNRTKKNTQFVLEIDNNAFTCPKSVEIPANGEGAINVIYEPCDVENVTSTLTASSSTAGQFIYPIIGTYSLPKPQGPYTVTLNAPVVVSFKNVFNDRKTFEFIIDVPDIFTTDVSTANIEKKQAISVKVNLQTKKNEKNEIVVNKYPVTGKLIVCCTDGEHSYISWIYYLKGILE